MTSSRVVPARVFPALLIASLAAVTIQCGGGGSLPPPDEPSITLSSANVNFNGTQGGSDPAAQTVSVTNGGGGTLSGLTTSVSYTSGQPSGWLSAALIGGTAPSTLTLTATTGSLTEGTYTASVAVTSAAASNSPQSVSVTFTVGPAAGGSPSISLSSTDPRIFGSPQGGANPAAQTVQVTNGGTGTLSGLALSIAYGDGQPTGWLNASLSQTTAPSTLTVTVTTGSLTEGTYTGSVAVTSAAASNSPRFLSVSFTVTAPAAGTTILLSSESQAFSATQGGANPAAQTVQVTNGGTGTLSGLALNIAYGDGQPTGWLSASLNETTAPSTLTLTATTGSLTAGTYNASVAVTSAAASNSPRFLNVTFTVTSPPPEAPSGLTATVVSSSQIDLTWTDNASNEDGFNLEQCTGAGCTSFVEITLGANVTTYQSTGLSAETSYSYRVRARNSAGNSAYSNTVSATTPPTMAPPTNLTATAVSSSRIELTWTDNSSNEDGFQIERCTGASCTDFIHFTTVPRDFPRYPDTGLSAGTSYSYRVRASNDEGNSPYSNIASATTPP